MARIEYPSRSPYATTPQTSWYLGLLNPRSIPADESDRIVKIESKYQERPDTLSYDLYGTTDFWWVFAMRNMDKIQDPIFDLQPGIEIFVPTADRISELLG